MGPFMAARKDLLKAQSFTTQRLVAALVDRDPDNAVPSLRRLGMATFVGVLAGIVILAGFGIFGFLSKPTTQSWQEANAIVIDISAGAVFVYMEHPDEPDPAKRMQLHPVPNITSAKLITKGGPVHSVRTASLAKAVRGDAYGIVNAPSQLPDPKDMSTFPLRVCSIPGDIDVVTKKPRTRFTTLEIGVAPVPSRNDTFAVQVGTTQYLIMNGHRYALPTTGGGNSPLRDGAFALDLRMNDWVDSLPADPPMEALVIPGVGNKPTKPESGNIGRLVSTGDTKYPDQLTYWVLLNDGYARIGYLDMRLLVLKYNREPINVPNSETDGYQSKSTLPSALPLERPKFYNDGNSFAERNVCATYVEGRDTPFISVDNPNVPSVAALRPPTTSDSTEVLAYDLIVGVPGGGALVRGFDTLESGGGATLIWQNHRYGIPDLESRAALGYKDKPTITPIWSRILARIPAGLPNGVLLSHAAAAGTKI